MHKLKVLKQYNKVHCFYLGLIYDVIVEPPSVGQTTDERGNPKPVAFLAYRYGTYVVFLIVSTQPDNAFF